MGAIYLSLGAVCFGTNTGLVIARYGLRDHLMWMSAAFWATLSICAYGAWLPYAPYAIPVVFIAGVATLLRFHATRRAFLCVLAATVSYAASSVIFSFLFQPTAIPGVATFVTSVAIEAVVLARLRPVDSHEVAS